MEKHTYLILRLTEPVAEGYDPLRPAIWRSDDTPQAAPAPDSPSWLLRTSVRFL